MCGIVGYVGAWNAAPVLLSGLSRLEYRGYDSAGIAVSDLRDGENRIEILKAKGRLQALKEMTDNGKAVSGTCGIGHTRWATHGGAFSGKRSPPLFQRQTDRCGP